MLNQTITAMNKKSRKFYTPKRSAIILDVLADALTYAATLIKDNAARVEAFRIVREINALSESLRVKK